MAKEPTSLDGFASRVYDYVIIGGGTAGLVVAARLTEDPNITVAVLEAGENRLDDSQINIPALFTTLYNDPKYDWDFKTAPQTRLNNRTVDYPRGKVLGGSSAINFMMVTHASRRDLDNWAALGNPGWGFDDLQPYYRKFETFTADDAKVPGMEIVEPDLHGNSGPIQTRLYPVPVELDDAWVPTLKTLGLDAKEDEMKGATLGGFKLLKYMDHNFQRSYAASAYYAPIANRPNLNVLTGALVKKIQFSKRDGEVIATGVRVVVGEKEINVSASIEVILAAGSVQSPQLLEVSGIGGNEILQKHDIDVVVTNPNVGENLQDHTLVPLIWEAQPGFITGETINQPSVLDWAKGEYQAGRGGPLASGVSGSSFLSHASILKAIGEESPTVPATLDIPITAPSNQAQLMKANFLNPGEAELQFNFASKGWNPYSQLTSGILDHNDPGNFVGLATGLTHPFSRGSIHIQSADTTVHPVINPRYLSHPLDLELMTDALLFAQKVSETEPFASYLKDRPDGKGKIIQPSFKIVERLTRENATEFVKETISSSWHPVGTCAMLPEADGGVVNSKLKVYGVGNLRIVDASVIPLQVRGNIASAVYAIAEKAADLIKEERKAT